MHLKPRNINSNEKKQTLKQSMDQSMEKQQQRIENIEKRLENWGGGVRTKKINLGQL